MGGIISRGSSGNEVVEIRTNNAYRYPPKSGSYFGNHFIMGGERFEMTQPEAYLFGGNQDLNFLGNRPIPFPYPSPVGNEPTKTLKSLVNIRKDSVKFVKVVEPHKEGGDRPPESPSSGTDDGKDQAEDNADETVEEPKPVYKYNVEFTFDADAKCAITIYYFATEEITGGQIVYHPRDPSMNSETFHYKRGANQVFNQSTHIVEPLKFPEDEWQYSVEKDFYPVVIHCVVEEEENAGHSHITFATVEKATEGFTIKPLKQKQFVDGLCYLLQEIYGIENKSNERPKQLDPDDEMEDSGLECVICMSDTRDTLILPCRHLCLCNGCAESLRYQSSCCPFCRAPFRALLQIRAMRKKQALAIQQVLPESDENPVSQEGVPQGYEAVSLIEALNGQSYPPLPPSAPPPPLEGLIPGHRIVEDGPKPDKRKSVKRRQSEERSAPRDPIPEAKEDKVTTTEDLDAVGDGRGTPEVVMTDQSPDPVKSSRKSPRKAPVPKVRYVQKVSQSAPVSPEGEVLSLKAKSASVEAVRDITPEADYPESVVVQMPPTGAVTEETVVASDQTGIDIELNTGEDADDERESTEEDEPAPDYEGRDLPAAEYAMADPVEVRFKVPRKGFATKTDEKEESEEYHPLALTESLSLPGTPVSSTDVSSYSSTTSSHMLLSGITSVVKDETEEPLSSG